MAYLKSVIDAGYFWEDSEGRTVFYPQGKRKSGYYVDSGADESKMRALVEMFTFAAMAVNLLGYLAGYGLGQYFIHIFFERPYVHLPAVMGIVSGSLFVLMIVPGLYLRKMYGKAAAIFTAGLREAPPCPAGGSRAPAAVLAAIGACVLLVGLGLAFLIGHRP